MTSLSTRLHRIDAMNRCRTLTGAAPISQADHDRAALRRVLGDELYELCGRLGKEDGCDLETIVRESVRAWCGDAL